MSGRKLCIHPIMPKKPSFTATLFPGQTREDLPTPPEGKCWIARRGSLPPATAAQQSLGIDSRQVRKAREKDSKHTYRTFELRWKPGWSPRRRGVCGVRETCQVRQVRHAHTNAVDDTGTKGSSGSGYHGTKRCPTRTQHTRRSSCTDGVGRTVRAVCFGQNTVQYYHPGIEPIYANPEEFAALILYALRFGKPI